MSDVFVSRNRNALRQVFGFVRFSNVKEVDKPNKALNNVYFGNQMVWVNVAQLRRKKKLKFTYRGRKKGI